MSEIDADDYRHHKASGVVGERVAAGECSDVLSVASLEHCPTQAFRRASEMVGRSATRRIAPGFISASGIAGLASDIEIEFAPVGQDVDDVAGSDVKSSHYTGFDVEMPVSAKNDVGLTHSAK